MAAGARRLPAPRAAWHEAALRRALRRAGRFIVAAEVVADDLADAGAAPDAITVIPMGSDHLPPPDFEASGRPVWSAWASTGPSC